MKRFFVFVLGAALAFSVGCSTPTKSQEARGLDGNDVRRENAKVAVLTAVFGFIFGTGDKGEAKPATPPPSDKPAEAPAPAK